MKDDDKKKILRHNLIFISVISFSIAFLTGFILLAISMILVRGLPGLWSGLFSREVKFAIFLSFYTSLISTAFCIVVGLPVSYGMSRLRFPCKRLVSAILDIPMALPPLVSGVALLLLFGTTPFGRTLAKIGLQFVFSVKGIILAQFFVNLPYMLRILISTIENIDPRMEFVARTLGCNRWQAFSKVTLPLARPGLIAGVVITWARALGEFGAVLILAGATRLKTETLPIALFLNMSCGELDLALTSASILILISVCSLFLFQILAEKKPVEFYMDNPRL